MRPVNPFLLTGYVSPEYFCDREIETQKIISALHNGRNITLISPRRMGKTGLIRHVFQKVLQQEDIMCYYVDLYQTHDLSSFVKKLGDIVLGTLDTKEEKIVKHVFAFFKSLRPTVSLDPLTGEPGFSIDVKPEFAEASLQEILSYMENSGKRCYVSFDEFQTIATYEDKNVEALLRAYIQHLTAVNFIFSGSQRHILENMFVSASRPFYQSSQIINLGRITKESYYEFARDKFAEQHQNIDEATFDYLYNKLYGHTWYVQMLLNRLYEMRTSEITIDVVDSMLAEIIDENEATYQTFLRLITAAQVKLLRAIAVEGEARELMSHDFIQRHHLGASSTVKSALQSLINKELVLMNGDSYQVYDRFFMYWLNTNCE